MFNNSKAFILFKILINPSPSSLLIISNSFSSFVLLELLFSSKFESLKLLIADNIFSEFPFSKIILLIFSIILWNQLINMYKIWNILLWSVNFSFKTDKVTNICEIILSFLIKAEIQLFFCSFLILLNLQKLSPKTRLFNIFIFKIMLLIF